LGTIKPQIKISDSNRLIIDANNAKDKLRQQGELPRLNAKSKNKINIDKLN